MWTRILVIHILIVCSESSSDVRHFRVPGCPPLSPTTPHVFRVRYSLRHEGIRCGFRCPIGALAHVTCDKFYEPETAWPILCMPDGRWNFPLPRCLPVCGRGTTVVSLIVDGVKATPGHFPWHVAIYNTYEGKPEFWCGGSLISQYAVLTAAHCTWQLKPENLILAVGKFQREIDSNETTVQLAKARKIEMLDSYQDAAGNYVGDISVVLLEKEVRLNRFVRPVCLDWTQRNVDRHLKEGTIGTVLGWGLTENDTFSDYLRVLTIPTVSTERCLAEQKRDFRQYITYTSFCAGYGNGTGVCNGDSGGGLVFLDPDTNRWVLQGLVSASPRRMGTPYCDLRYYTVFTKVSFFANWLKKMNLFKLESREDVDTSGTVVGSDSQSSQGNVTDDKPSGTVVKVQAVDWVLRLIKRYLDQVYDGSQVASTVKNLFDLILPL